VGEFIDVKHGFAFPGDRFRAYPTCDILLTPGNFAIGGGSKEDKVKYSEGLVSPDYILHQHDLVLTMTDLSKSTDTLGLPALIPVPPSGCRYLHNQRLGKVIITKSGGVNTIFLYWLFCSEAYRHEILSGATGTTVKHTSPSRIKAFSTVFPPSQVLQKFEEIAMPWYLKEASNRVEFRTLAALRDTLLPRLLSGELSVADISTQSVHA